MGCEKPGLSWIILHKQTLPRTQGPGFQELEAPRTCLAMLRLSPWCTQPTPPRAWGRGSAGGRPEELDEQQTQAQQLSKDIRSLRQKPPGQGPSRTACWSGPEATKVHSRARGDWSRRALGVFSANPTARLVLGPWEQRSCSEAPPSSPAPPPPHTCPAQGKPHGQAPTVGQPVLTGDLANKSPALMSGARKRAANFSQDGQEDTPRKAQCSPLTCWSGPWASLITWLVERRPGSSLTLSGALICSGRSLGFQEISQNQPPQRTNGDSLLPANTAPLRRCRTLQKNSQRSGGGWLFSSKGAIA